MTAAGAVLWTVIALGTLPQQSLSSHRTANDGSFTFRNVPPGEYYLAPVDDVEPGEWYDPSLLQRLTTSAIKLTIAEGEKKTQDLKVGGG